ncbi:MAG: thioredoxin family protein [Planctomyces sp.]|nr:thioredoxin family protein [Planctomyces sp.]
MRTLFNATALGALAVGLLALSISAADTAKPSVKWETDLQEAHKLSVESGKPMLLVFGADWCHYCKKLEQSTLTNTELAKYINANFIPVHIDADDEPKVTEILEVTGLPCSVVLSPNADLLGRINGYKQPSAFYGELVQARRRHAAVQTASSKISTAPAAVAR